MKIPPRGAHPGRLSSSVGNADLKYTQKNKREDEHKEGREQQSQNDRGAGDRRKDCDGLLGDCPARPQVLRSLKVNSKVASRTSLGSSSKPPLHN